MGGRTNAGPIDRVTMLLDREVVTYFKARAKRLGHRSFTSYMNVLLRSVKGGLEGGQPVAIADEEEKRDGHA